MKIGSRAVSGGNSPAAGARTVRALNQFQMRRAFPARDAAPEDFTPSSRNGSLRGLYLLLPSAFGEAFGVRIFLRDKPASDTAQERTDRFPSLFVSPCAHDPNHEARDVWKLQKVRSNAGTRYARCS
jgi:hypothetical protein